MDREEAYANAAQSLKQQFPSPGMMSRNTLTEPQPSTIADEAGAALSVADRTDVTASDNFIEGELQSRLMQVEAAMNADAIVCIHPILPPYDDLVRQRIEDIPNKRDNLLVILETDGGSIETCERIADVFRHHYAGEISFLIPNYAMSAGTILVMSGDRILMDYYSVLGPIDPQIRNAEGDYVPALGYLAEYNEIRCKGAGHGRIR